MSKLISGKLASAGFFLCAAAFLLPRSLLIPFVSMDIHTDVSVDNFRFIFLTDE